MGVGRRKREQMLISSTREANDEKRSKGWGWETYLQKVPTRLVRFRIARACELVTLRNDSVLILVMKSPTCNVF